MFSGARFNFLSDKSIPGNQKQNQQYETLFFLTVNLDHTKYAPY